MPTVSLLLALSALLSAAMGLAQGEGDLASKERELQALRAQIEDARATADALADDEKQQLARIHALEREASLTEQLLERLARKEIVIRAQIDTLQVEIDAARGRVASRRERLSERLRAMYMRPRRSLLAAALTSEDLGELTARLRVLTHVARTERALIDEVQDAQADLRARRGELAAQMAEINLTRSETEDRKLQLTRLQDERQTALMEVRAERARFEASVTEMEDAAASMQALIAELERRRRERTTDEALVDHAFASSQGRLDWPVRGPVLKPYGRSVHPEFKTVVVNKGVNIGASMGTPIRCVAPGTVEYVDWLPGYGKCIIVDHGDGYYTLYAHASAIFPAEGSVVQAGEVLGEVGDTGSLNGSQLYFEIRKGKDSLDPSTWLSPRDG